MKKVQITETVLRDANQSLMATRLPYSDFEAILPEMDKAGYYSAECWGGATFDSCLRYLDEDPWERLRKIRKLMPNTKLQMLLRGQHLLGYKHYHDDVVEKFVQLSIKNGIDIIRIFDALNDFRNLGTALDATMKYAKKNTIASGCISDTHSPVSYTHLDVYKRQVQHDAHVVLRLVDDLLVIRLAQERQHHAVAAQRRLNDVGDIMLVLFLVEVGQILAGRLLMALEIVVLSLIHI